MPQNQENKHIALNLIEGKEPLIQNTDTNIQNDLYFTSGFLERCTASFLIKKLSAINYRITKNNAEIKNLSQKTEVYKSQESEFKLQLYKLQLLIKDEQKMVGANPEVIESMEQQLNQINLNLMNLNKIMQLKLDQLDIEELCVIYNQVFSIPVKEQASAYDTILSINQYLPEKVAELKKLQIGFINDIHFKSTGLQAHNNKIAKLIKELHVLEHRIETINNIIKSFEHDIRHINEDTEKQFITVDKIHEVLDS